MHSLAPAPALDHAERRGADRRTIGLDTTMRGDDAAPVHARVLDLSSEGFRLACDEPLSIGDAVTVGLPGVGRYAARVVRQEPGGYGCRFDQPIADRATLAAFAGETVVRGRFGDPAMQPTAAMPEPVVERWHPAVRLTMMLGCASALWTAIFHLS